MLTQQQASHPALAGSKENPRLGLVCTSWEAAPSLVHNLNIFTTVRLNSQVLILNSSHLFLTFMIALR